MRPACVPVLSPASTAAERPNILVIWGDEIGWENISAYHRGLTGGRTPNSNRIANEGAMFTDHYALDGYNFMPYFRGDTDQAPRREIFYFDDNASLNAVRVTDWKIHFKVQEGNLQDSFTLPVNMPYVVNLRQDRYECFMRESRMYFRWYADKLGTFIPAQTVVAQWIVTFEEFPPSQPSATFGPDQALQALSAPGRGL